MEVDKLVNENPKNLLVGKNSRWRADGNLSELMESIKQNGILQPIVARSEDHVVVCGNRRLASAIKLQMTSIPVRYVSGINDKELLILNLTENLQRKDISSIEIGRICDSMIRTTAFKISAKELAIVLGVGLNRIKTCLDAFHSLPEQFRDSVVHMDQSQLRKVGDLPENVVAFILQFGRSYRKITHKDLVYFLKKAGENILTMAQLRIIGRLYTQGMTLQQAIANVDTYSVIRLDIIALKTEFESVMKKEHVSNKHELIRKIIREKYPSLIF